MKNKRFILWLMFVLVSGMLQAQTFEIRAVNKGYGHIGVELRMTAGAPPTSADFVTDMVFGLKWLSSYNVDLENSITTNYDIIKSGTRGTHGIYHYQAFSASNTPMNFPANWALNTWVEVMSIRNTMTGVGTGTFEITEAGFDVTTEPNFGVSLVDHNPAIAGSATVVPLPVVLTRFDAIGEKNQIRLSWETQQEENSKGFEIQRTTGSADFITVGWVNSKGNGNTKQQYEWIDQDVVSGPKYHYRLKQIDLDDRYSYSMIRTAWINETGSGHFVLRPNPANNYLQVLFSGAVETSKVLIKITDSRGAVVMQRYHDLNTGRKVELNITLLANGQYFLTVENSKGLLQTKLFMKE
jgi:hypothetical protein